MFMRKIKRKHPIKIHTILIIFTLILFGISTGYSLLSETLSVAGKGKMIVINDPIEKEGIRFTYTVDSWYSNGKFYYNFAGTLVNLTESNIDGWKLEFPIPEDVTEVICSDAVCSVNDNVLIITNTINNSVLVPNVETKFDFQFTSIIGGYTPEDVIINDDNPILEPTPDSVLQVELELVTTWGGYDSSPYTKQYNAIITNTSDTDTKTWSFKVGFPKGFVLANAWGCNYIVYKDSVLFSNSEWGGIIGANKSINFTLQVITESSEYTPDILEVSNT